MMDAAPLATPMRFEMRPPSVQWEALALLDVPQVIVWAWFRPTHSPMGVVISIPDELFQVPALPPLLTVRRFATSAGVDPASLVMWFLFGVPQDAQRGFSPLLDQPIPQPVAGGDRTILIVTQPTFVPVPMVAPMPHVAAMPMPMMPVTGSTDVLLDRIGVDWTASLHLEKELESMRRQLSSVSARLNSLNRDLTSDERMASDREDKDDWQDVRRILRDAAGRLSRFMKECDVGETVYAGKKQWFEQIYEQHVVPRQQFAGIEQAVSEFESYRKTVQVLVNNTRAALNNAAQDAERRAQAVLSRIAGKAAALRAKR